MADAKSNLENLNVLLGVTGGIAAYKAAELASKLTAAGTAVKTVMTENACRMISSKTFETLTGNQVFTTLWGQAQEFSTAHISLADWADIVVVAPATANIIAKIATGICDDILSTTLCVCWQKPKLMAPAMNTNMWLNPMVQKNIQTITEMGYKLIGPEKGRLACATEDVGRMSEPEHILKQIEKIASEFCS